MQHIHICKCEKHQQQKEGEGKLSCKMSAWTHHTYTASLKQAWKNHNNAVTYSLQLESYRYVG